MMKRSLVSMGGPIPSLVCIVLLGMGSFCHIAEGGGGTVHKNPKELTQTSKVPKYPALLSAAGSTPSLGVRTMIGERNLGEKKTEGRAGFHGTLTTVKRFVRIEIKTNSSLTLPSKAKVVYSVKNGD